MKFKSWPLLATLLLTSLSSAHVFTVTDLGPNVGAVSINDYGQVAENRLASDGVTVRAGVWRKNDGFKPLAKLPGATSTYAVKINNHGDVVGSSAINGVSHATLWLSTGRVKDLGGLFTSLDSFADDINDSRIVTLSGFLDILPGFNVFVWSERMGLVAIGEGGAGYIDAFGNVAGSFDKGNMYLWSRFSGRRLVELPDGGVAGIDSGYVLAFSTFTGVPFSIDEALLYNLRNGRRLFLGLLPLDGQPGFEEESIPGGLNSFKQVVGGSFPDRRGWLWTPWTGILDLNHLTNAPAWQLFSGSAINNKTQIVGQGSLNDIPHAFLLTFRSRRR